LSGHGTLLGSGMDSFQLSLGLEATKQPVRARFACVLRTGPTSHICGYRVHSNGLRFFVRMTRGDTKGSLSGEPYNASRCNTENTKRPELRFRAVLGDGTREVRFERVIG
jgi:hypothetical protein